MAITNYSTLKAAVADWLDRDDLTSQIDTFLDLTEAVLARELRIKPMETALSSAISGGVLAVPSDYLELRFAYVDGSPVRWLELKDPGWIYLNYPTRSSTSKPYYIGREGDNFIFGPYPDDGYTIKGSYYAKLAALSASNETNWFTANAPDLLLFGCLLQATPYVGDDERAVLWGVQFSEALDRVRNQDKRERWAERASLRMTTA